MKLLRIEKTSLEASILGNAKAPSFGEIEWIRSFGKYPKFNPSKGKLSTRITIKVADLKQVNKIIVNYHYLHRGRTMAQLPYWITVDEVPVGVFLFSLPRLSVPVDGVPPMNLLELARFWLSPDVQKHKLADSEGKSHSVSIASCALGKALRTVRQDWFLKYPSLPEIIAVVSWADTEHHEGTIYKATNFAEMGISGGTMHGARKRPNGGRDQLNIDYAHIKTRFIFKFDKPLSEVDKIKLIRKSHDM